MEHIATFAKVLGSLFYFPVTHENNRQLCAALRDHDAEQASPFHDVLIAMDKETPEALAEDFQQLFEGCEVMPAPPWGSVYLDKEQVIFGESTVAFRHFLTAQDMALDTGMREPEDQLGLMLMVLGMLLEAERNDRAKILLAEHLMPWFDHFHQRFHAATTVNAYRMLSETTAALLQALCARDGIVVALKRDYRDVEY